MKIIEKDNHRFIPHNDSINRCPFCGDNHVYIAIGPYKQSYMFECPDCGAKMDGGEDGKEPTD